MRYGKRYNGPREANGLLLISPNFFTDIKADNFGMFRGGFVCHDYGCNLAMYKKV